jgi:hypothetical protein
LATQTYTSNGYVPANFTAADTISVATGVERYVEGGITVAAVAGTGRIVLAAVPGTRLTIADLDIVVGHFERLSGTTFHSYA